MIPDNENQRDVTVRTMPFNDKYGATAVIEHNDNWYSVTVNSTGDIELSFKTREAWVALRDAADAIVQRVDARIPRGVPARG